MAQRKLSLIQWGKKIVSTMEMLKDTWRLTRALAASAHVHLNPTAWKNQKASYLETTLFLTWLADFLSLFCNSRENICIKTQSWSSKSLTTFVAYSPIEIVIFDWIIWIMSWWYKLQVLTNNKSKLHATAHIYKCFNWGSKSPWQNLFNLAYSGQRN